MSSTPDAGALARLLVGVLLALALLAPTLAAMVLRAPAVAASAPPRAGAPVVQVQPAGRPAPRAPGAPSGAAQIQCLAQAVYFEARGESAAGQAAVAQVVLNRTRTGGWPHTVCGVVRERLAGAGCQFSFECDGSLARRKDALAWRRSGRVARRALGGYVMKAVRGAISFHAAGLGEVWGGRMVEVAHVGGQVFYRARTVAADASAASPA